ncbi:MAG: bactofilin family protein [Elusimicrobiota bacterium]
MFKSSKNKACYGKVETLISQETSIEGTIEAMGTIRVDGTIKGGIKKAEAVIIGENGIIEGNVHAGSISLGGKVKGDIRADKTLELLPGATLNGDMETLNLSISEGSHFDGVCHMIEEGSNGKSSKKKNINLKNRDRAKKSEPQTAGEAT